MINLNQPRPVLLNNQRAPKATNSLSFGANIQKELDDIFQRRVKNRYNDSTAADCVYVLRKLAIDNFNEVEKFLVEKFIPNERKLNTSFSEGIIEDCEELIRTKGKIPLNRPLTY